MSTIRATLETKGYYIGRGIFNTSELAVMREFVNVTADSEFDDVLGRCQNDAERVAKINALVAASEYVGLDGRVKDCIIGNLPLNARLSRVFWPIFHSAKLLEILRAIFDSPDVFFHMAPAVRTVLSHSIHSAVPAHQDLSYNSHMVSSDPGVLDFVTVWVPFNDITDDCGGVAVYDGSGRSPAQEVQYGDIWIKPVDTNGYQPIHCKMNVGDALIFNKFLIHESMPNKSAHRRISLDCRAFGRATQSSKHYLDLSVNQIIAPLGRSE